MDKQIVISIKTILITFLFALVVYVLYRLGPIIGILIVSLLIVISMEKAVHYFMKQTVLNRKVSRKFAVAISYLLFVGFLVFAGSMIIPPFIEQFQKLLLGLSNLTETIYITDDFSISLASIIPTAETVSSEVLSATISLFGNVSMILSVVVISVYMSIDWENIKKKLFSILPSKLADDIEEILDSIEDNLGNWIKGELILMFSIGLASFVGLVILDVRYPLALAFVAGLLEIVPMIGPFVSAFLAAIIAFGDAPIKAVGVIVLFAIIQQLENNLLVPKIMGRVSGFSPIIILLALLIGTEFFGVVGAILAIPITMVIAIVIKKVLRSQP